MSSTRNSRQGGFTLVELIIALVMVGILAAMVALFIKGPIQSYVDTAGRADLTDDADLALRRMARDMRLALPNSIRTAADGHAIEFLLTKGGGRYLAAEDAQADNTNQWALEFDNPAALNQFTVVGAMPSLSQHIMDDLFNYVVVYNLGPGFAPADAYQLGQLTNSNIALMAPPIRDGAQNVTAIKLQTNPFKNQAVSMPSPSHRFQVISGGVTYWCGSHNGSLTLMRYWNYGINATMADPPAGNSAVLATSVTSCAGLFNYSTLRNQHSGLVILRLSLNARNPSDPPLTLVDQVHVDNVP